MPTVQRFDRMPLRATRTAEGFVQDTAVLTRTGIFEYRQPNGSIRREYRPPEEVFHADSLASYKGKPITIGHPGLVTSKNAKLHTCGACLGEGRADGNDVLGDLMIYDTSAIDAGAKELSNGSHALQQVFLAVGLNGEGEDLGAHAAPPLTRASRCSPLRSGRQRDGTRVRRGRLLQGSPEPHLGARAPQAHGTDLRR